MNTIGENIAYYRKQKKLTQEGLAELLGVTSQAVSKWECDTSYPDITVMQALANTLNISVDDLLGKERKIPEVREASADRIDRRILLIEVHADQTKITTRFPVAAVKKAMENGTLRKLVGEDACEQVASMSEMIDSGITGPLTDIEAPGAHISIQVVDYEN